MQQLQPIQTHHKQPCTHCGAPVRMDNVITDPRGAPFHEACWEAVHEEMFMSQDDDIEAALAEIEEKVERVKEQAQERGESEGVQLKRCYDKARSERKSLEQELEERIKEHPELRRLQEKVKQAKEREKEAKKDWRTEVYEPAKRDAERLKNKREGRLAQLEEQLLDWVEERGRVGLVEAYEGAKSRADIEGTTIEKKGVTFRVKTWESMRLDDEIDDP